MQNNNLSRHGHRVSYIDISKFIGLHTEIICRFLKKSKPLRLYRTTFQPRTVGARFSAHHKNFNSDKKCAEDI